MQSACIPLFIALLLVVCTPAQNTTTTPTPYVRGACIHAVWNDPGTFAGILIGCIVGGILMGLAIGYGVGEVQKGNWKISNPWAKSRMDQDYMYRPVIIAPIAR